MESRHKKFDQTKPKKARKTAGDVTRRTETGRETDRSCTAADGARRRCREGDSVFFEAPAARGRRALAVSLSARAVCGEKTARGEAAKNRAAPNLAAPLKSCVAAVNWAARRCVANYRRGAGDATARRMRGPAELIKRRGGLVRGRA